MFVGVIVVMWIVFVMVVLVIIYLWLVICVGSIGGVFIWVCLVDNDKLVVGNVGD